MLSDPAYFCIKTFFDFIKTFLAENYWLVLDFVNSN